MELYTKASVVFTNLFPVWLTLFSAVALKDPAMFAWFTTEYFTGGLALLMLSMGITLSPRDFVNVLKRPNAVVVGFGFCYAVMPALAYGLGIAAGLSPALLAGLVLVGCINGGQASNLCTYIANGNVALSVMMTTITTLGAIVMTPLLCKLLLGAVVPVDALGIARSTVEVVLAPIAVGMATNKYFPKLVKAVLPITPVVGVLSTCFLVASAVAQVAPTIISAGIALQIPIILLHLVGGLLGYLVPRKLGFSEVSSRTMAIETSMKSSAFGFLLAKLHFGSFEARVPAAVSVVWMAITGSLLAIVWRYIPVKAPKFDRGVKARFEKVNLLNAFKKKDAA
ncbi:putative anion:sodium symporter [Tribonema minus]|uniref:Putative anion:sodium symporter n=1 Tax=Tribonema minus TaxID=303371 RepID=A0A836CI93_9STRA|nr:putative anion:sodium symporter [Tribonema minus]